MSDLEALANPQIQNRKRKDEKLSEARDRMDFRAVMGTANGRRVVYRILQFTNVDGDSFHQDARIEAYTLGRQSVGRVLRSVIGSHCPDMFSLMFEEAVALQKIKAAEDEEDTKGEPEVEE